MPCPDAALDPFVVPWLDAARQIGFECPRRPEEAVELRRALGASRRRTGELEAGLRLDEPVPAR